MEPKPFKKKSIPNTKKERLVLDSCPRRDMYTCHGEIASKKADRDAKTTEKFDSFAKRSNASITKRLKGIV